MESCHYADDDKEFCLLQRLKDNGSILKRVFSKLVAIIDIDTGGTMAEIEYWKKIQNFTEVFISAKKNVNIIFRFIELKNPENILFFEFICYTKLKLIIYFFNKVR